MRKLCILMFLMACSACWGAGRTVKIGIIADVQGSDQADTSVTFAFGGKQYRRFTTAITRLREAVTTFNAENVDIVVDCGDFIDGSLINSDPTEFTYPALLVDELESLNAGIPWITAIGNHEQTQYDSAQDVIDYYTEIDVVHATRANVFVNTDSWEDYTYDFKGIRFVVLSNETADTDWLTEVCTESKLPIIVISHMPAWDTSTNNVWHRADRSAIQTIIQASGKLQAVFSGHYHWGNLDSVISNVPHYNFWGSVLAPNEADNAYYIMEIVPNAISTADGFKPNIKITGYGSNGLAKNRDFTKYIF